MSDLFVRKLRVAGRLLVRQTTSKVYIFKVDASKTTVRWRNLHILWWEGASGAQGWGVEGTRSRRVFAHCSKESGLELVDSEKSWKHFVPQQESLSCTFLLVHVSLV